VAYVPGPSEMDDNVDWSDLEEDETPIVDKHRSPQPVTPNGFHSLGSKVNGVSWQDKAEVVEEEADAWLEDAPSAGSSPQGKAAGPTPDRGRAEGKTATAASPTRGVPDDSLGPSVPHNVASAEVVGSDGLDSGSASSAASADDRQSASLTATPGAAETALGLPEGWVQELDQQSGYPYYVNLVTGESSWERPEVPVPTQGAADKLSAVLPENWIEQLDPVSGYPFYVNTLTGESSWEQPTTHQSTSDTAQEHAKFDSSNGIADHARAHEDQSVEHVSRENGEYNVKTNDALDGSPSHGQCDGGRGRDPVLNEAVLPSDAVLEAPKGLKRTANDGANVRPHIEEQQDGSTDGLRSDTGEDGVRQRTLESEILSGPPMRAAVGNSQERPLGSTTQTDTGTEIESPVESALAPIPFMDGNEDNGEDELAFLDESSMTRESVQPLPEGWVEQVDPTYGHPFFVNTLTGESQWTRPESAPSTAHSACGSTATEDDSEPTVPDEVVTSKLDLPLNWVQHFDEGSGHYYYLNTSTGESSWVPPQTSGPVASEEDHVPSQVGAHASPWIAQLDETSGHTYYVNQTSGESTWERPADLIEDYSQPSGQTASFLEPGESSDAASRGEPPVQQFMIPTSSVLPSHENPMGAHHHEATEEPCTAPQPVVPVQPQPHVSQPFVPLNAEPIPSQPFMPAMVPQHAPYSAGNQFGTTAGQMHEQQHRQNFGRPSCAIASVGFNGVTILCSPKESGNGRITTHSLSDLLTQVAGSAAQLEIDCLTKKGSIMGPFSHSTKQTDTLVYASSKAAECDVEMHYGDTSSLRLLWGFLGHLVKHKGVSGVRGPAGTAEEQIKASEEFLALIGASASAQGSTVASTDGNGPYESPSGLLPNGSVEKWMSHNNWQGLASEEADTAREIEKLVSEGQMAAAHAKALQGGGRLVGLAFVLAMTGRLGPEALCKTAAAYARDTFSQGSGLRSLGLLAGGAADELFAEVSSSAGSSIARDWKKHMATILSAVADPTVVKNLGDQLFSGSEGASDVFAAHLCYIAASCPLEKFSPQARVCLVGADHRRFPRTYATVQSFQRTELVEAAYLLQNSQCILPTFQPYKLLYAYQLAEVGKTKEALLYCEAVIKSLKLLPRDQVSDVCYSQAVDLENRLRSNLGILQGAFAGGNLLSGLFRAVDRGINKIIGEEIPAAGPQLSAPPSRSGSATTLSSLDGSKTSQQSESAQSQKSEQKETPGKKGDGEGGMGLLARSLSFLQKKPKNQAKLGLEENKFFYDEKLKIWRVEGEEIPQEALPPAPPPTVSTWARFCR